MRFFPNEWREYEMHMVRHDHRHVKFILLAMIVTAGRENNIARPLRQGSPELRDEGDEMGCEVPLNVWQVPPVKLHRGFYPAGLLASTQSKRDFRDPSRSGTLV